jgi:uncharacterized protein (DUF433 family)
MRADAKKNYDRLQGADEKAVLQAYPTLKSKDVHAALRYAADSLAHEEVVLSVAE